MEAKLYVRFDLETGKPTGKAVMTTLEAARLNMTGNWLWVPTDAPLVVAEPKEQEPHHA